MRGHNATDWMGRTRPTTPLYTTERHPLLSSDFPGSRGLDFYLTGVFPFQDLLLFSIRLYPASGHNHLHRVEKETFSYLLSEIPPTERRKSSTMYITKLCVGDAYEGTGDPTTKHLGRNRKSRMHFSCLFFWRITVLHLLFRFLVLLFCAPANHHGLSHTSAIIGGFDMRPVV